MVYYFLKRSMHKGIILMMVIFCTPFVNAQEVHHQLEVKWTIAGGDLGKENPVSKLIFYNSSKENVACKNWSLWFNFMRGINVNSVDEKFKIVHRNGDLYQLSFLDKNIVIPANGSITISFKTKGTLPNFTDAPAGLYITYDDATEINAHPVKYSTIPNEYSLDEKLNILTNQYELNRLHEPSAGQKIIPSPLALQQGEGFYTISSKSTFWVDHSFEKEGIYLREFLKETSGISLSSKKQTEKSAAIKILQNKLLGEEEYELVINSKGITIFASTNKGAFYAIQTVKSLSPAQYWNVSSGKMEIPAVTIKDKPRYGYRGLMLDVARNFHSKETVKKIIDLMAMYKLNTLHMHLNDDEGWRLEIPSLPELTEVGSVRSGFYADGNSLQPAYGSGANPQTKLYYTVSDFKEILIYAQKKHIQVIPELETPGHARAAIKSMDARYKRFMKEGNVTEARRYLLRDTLDKSVYTSVQRYHDNVMNVALPSTYNFIEKVVDEVIDIYAAADAELKTIHLGGDEVPEGVWEKSPAIKQLMKDQNIKTYDDLWYYYLAKADKILKSKGLYLSGWEEVAMRKVKVNNKNQYIANPDFVKNNFHAYVWNNVWGWGQEDLAYRLANAGYKVILAPVTNFYFDLAYEKDVDESGLYWGSFVDVDKPFYYNPFDHYKTAKEDPQGNKIDTAIFKNKERLTNYGISNIVGLQCQIWSEVVRSPEQLEYMLIPKLMGFAERAWAKTPEWITEINPQKTEELYQQDWNTFVNVLGQRDLVRLDAYSGGYNYRIPSVGAKVENGKVIANMQLPGFTIRYTSNGQEPDAKSKIYAGPIKAKGMIKLKLFNAKGRSGRTVTVLNQ